MPVIDIQYQKGSLTEAAKAELPTRLGQIAIGYEGLEGSQFAREFTWVYLHEMPANQVTQVSGAPPKPIYRLRFTTLQSLLNNESKHRLGEDVTRAIYEAEGSAWNEEEAYNRVWIFFEDVREGDWIAGARINSLKGLREKLAEEKAVTTG
ncbi:hypothetical protein [Gimesia aquarii]|uniref:Tautomerase enzyme n=1 Tax=Gimesia aquarii TaxID=2527964 RepID=A0A517VUN3_9PLAN|nr:hypothetical protein [Gimesia aquarii]QDT96713.1 Tautomerase enzyme [Gimesia aquarii]